MHTIPVKRKKTLSMRRLTPQEVGAFRLGMIDLLTTSPDPYHSVIYHIEIEPLRALLKVVGAQTGKKITMTPAINKLLGLAVAENPRYNQILLGRKVYQLQEIHIANIAMLPGTDALTFLILENPHLKSLETLQQELLLMREERRQEFTSSKNIAVSYMIRLLLRTGLYRFVSKKYIFTMGFERGALSNISLSNHFFQDATTFMLAKDIVNTIEFAVRFHACGTVKQPCMENSRLTEKESMPLYATTDHRLINGSHANVFGQSLQRIASNPERYLL